MAQGEVVQVGTMVDPDNVIINNIDPPLFQEVSSIPIVGDRTYVRDVDIFTGTSGVPTNPDGTPVDPNVTFELLTTTVNDGVNNNSITAMDEWNLVTVAGRRSFSDNPDDQGGRPAWQTGNFGGKDTFTSTNDDGPDFILIENAANDDLVVQAVFPDGTTGQWTGLIVGDDQQVALWGDTGLVSPATSIGAGQGKFGVGWRVEDLLGADGNPLPQDTEIFALRFNDPTTSPDTGLDPCLLVAVIQQQGLSKVGTMVDPDNVIINNIDPPLFQEVSSIPIVGDRTYVRDVDIFTGTSGVPTNPDGTPVDPNVTFELLTTTVNDGVNNNSITAMDEWNLVTVAGRRSFSDNPDDQGGRPAWQTGNFGGKDTFTSTNKTGPDFILIENAANDDLTVQAVFPDGTTGQWTGLIVGDDQQVALWGDTGLVSPATSIGAGQGKFGVGWRVEDLLGADGNPLAPDTEIWALRFNDPTTSPDTGLDPCLLVAVIISDDQPTGNWQLVTDFEDANPEGNPTVNSNIVGTRIWNVDAEIPGFVGAEADPRPWAGDEGNMALHVDHQNTATGGMETALVLFPEDIVNGTTATLYFRWWMDKNGGHETAVALTSNASVQEQQPPYNVGETPEERNTTIKNGYGDHQTWWRLGTDRINLIQDFGYSVRDFDSYWPEELLGPQENGWDFLAAIPENRQYQPGVWMEMWIIYDTDNDIKMEYQRQNDGVQRQNKWAIIDADGVIQEVIDYQINHIGPTDQDYSGFYMVNWAQPAPNYDTQVYMDDVWIDYTGINLSTPPHGKTRSAIVVDTTPRAAVAAGIGSETISMSMSPPAEAEAGKFVQLEDGTTVGQIASIAGNVLTLEDPLTFPVPAQAALTFVDEAPFQVETGGKLINISTRGIVGDGDKAMIGGFIIGGSENKTVNILVRAGADLIAQGVPEADVLADPVLTLQRGQAVVRVNDNWEDDSDQAQLIADVWGGTSPLAAGSTSSGIVVTLAPGGWTARVNAADGTESGGVVLLEVYEVQE